MEEQDVIEAVKKVIDPEIQLDIWTIGLIYKIEVKDDVVDITMTLTSIYCPYGPSLIYDVKQKVIEAGAKDCIVKVTFEPAWEPSEDLRAMLGL